MLASVSEECWECDTSIDWISWKGGRSFDLQDLFLTLNRWSLQVESITNPLPAIGFSTADRLSIHHLHSFPFVHRSIEMIKTQISIFFVFFPLFAFRAVSFSFKLKKCIYFDLNVDIVEPLAEYYVLPCHVITSDWMWRNNKKRRLYMFWHRKERDLVTYISLWCSRFQMLVHSPCRAPTLDRWAGPVLIN